MKSHILNAALIAAVFACIGASAQSANILYEETRFRLKNHYRHAYLHLENRDPSRQNNKVELRQDVPDAWHSAQWSLDFVPGTRFFRLTNFWHGDQLHTEHGSLDAKVNVPDGWHSAMWELEGVPGTPYVRLKTRWKGQYLHTESGKPDILANVPKSWLSAMWELEPVQKNHAYGEYAGRCTVQLYTPEPILNLCPNSYQGHLRYGDHHFDRGVFTKLNLNWLDANEAINEIAPRLSLIMSEPRFGAATPKVVASWVLKLFTAPRNRVVHSATYSGFSSGLITDDSERLLPKSGGEFMQCNEGTQHAMTFDPHSFADSALVIGDTGGADVSEDTDCRCDSKIVALNFKPIAVCLEDEAEYEKRLAEDPPAVMQ